LHEFHSDASRHAWAGQTFARRSVVLKVELHAHTADDPVDHIRHTTRELIDRAAALRYDALAITLHDRQLDPAPLRAYAARRGITLIRGIERTVCGKHVLLLNFSESAEEISSFEGIARLRARESGLVIAPHPFFPAGSALMGALDEHADLFDAVEWNAMFTRTVNFNRRAERWAARHGKPMVGNGDVHRLYQLGTCYSLVDAARHPDSICEAIRAGRVRVQARPLSALRATRTMCDLFGTELAARWQDVVAPAAPQDAADQARAA
jgi:predicted metal-dependent phosphoesterase TrpH